MPHLQKILDFKGNRRDVERMSDVVEKLREQRKLCPFLWEQHKKTRIKPHHLSTLIEFSTCYAESVAIGDLLKHCKSLQPKKVLEQ